MRRFLLLMLTVPLVVWSARFPHYASRERQSLSGTWSFAWLGDKADVSSIDPSKVACPEVAAVPGVYDTSLACYGRRGTALYRRSVTTGEGRYRLTFEGLGLYAKVWLDGAILGEIKVPWSTVSFDFDARAGEQPARPLGAVVAVFAAPAAGGAGGRRAGAGAGERALALRGAHAGAARADGDGRAGLPAEGGAAGDGHMRRRGGRGAGAGAARLRHTGGVLPDAGRA